MAEEIQIRGTQEVGKIRHPLGPFGLSLLTLGFYYFFWYYKINKELAAIGQVRNAPQLGTAPGTSLLAITLGIFIIVPPYVSHYNTWKRFSEAEKLLGLPESMNPAVGFILTLFVGPVGMYFLQTGLNNVLRAQAQA